MEHNNLCVSSVWREILLAKDIIARKDEKARLKKISEHTKRGIMVPDEKATPIVDPEVEWKIPNITWLAEKAREAKGKGKSRIRINNHEDDEDDEDLIIDTIGDSNLRDAMFENDDFVDFEETHSHDDV